MINKLSFATESKIIGSDDLPPNAGNTIESLRSIGYTLNQAISDIVDNSIDARAKNILIRFVVTENDYNSIVIVDDGHGMTKEKISEAMRIGTNVERYNNALGKFGVGLKLASFSHAKSLTVFSRTINGDVGRHWDTDDIKSKGWKCGIIDPAQASSVIDTSWGGLNLSKQGTVVVWSKLDKFKSRNKAQNIHLSWGALASRLKTYIGLHFHRFIEDNRVKIFLDLVEDWSLVPTKIHEVEARNPFDYSKSGDKNYPATFTMDIPKCGKIALHAHIWPKNSQSKNYKLDGSTASRQGFYFYRNDRLIQAGGWNEILGSKNETINAQNEPHSSLARVMVDLPPTMDSQFSLDVQKTSLNVPLAFQEHAKDAQNVKIGKFSQFRSDAQKTYRAAGGPKSEHPVILGEGIPRTIRNSINKFFTDRENFNNEVEFVWKSFEPHQDQFIFLNKNENCIELNKNYRKFLLNGNLASKNDLPFIKTMIFVIFRDTFTKSGLSKKVRMDIDILNALVKECAKMEVV